MRMPNGENDEGQKTKKPPRTGEWSKKEMDEAKPFPMPEVADDADAPSDEDSPVTNDAQA